MVVEYIRYKINVEQQKSFIEAYNKASNQLENSKFCLGYELAHCEEKPENFILRIKWTSTDDHLNKFRESSGFSDFFQPIRPFFNNIEEMNHYNLTEIVGSK